MYKFYDEETKKVDFFKHENDLMDYLDERCKDRELDLPSIRQKKTKLIDGPCKLGDGDLYDYIAMSGGNNRSVTLGYYKKFPCDEDI